MQKQELRTAAVVAWRNGEYYDCGKALSLSFDRDERQTWAAGVLKAAVEGNKIPPIVRSLMYIIDDRSRWAEAKAEFGKIRAETIRVEKLGSKLELLGIYHLAENVAKVTYNSWLSDDGFDEDASYWIPYCVNFIIAHVRDEKRKNRIIDSLWQSPKHGDQFNCGDSNRIQLR